MSKTKRAQLPESASDEEAVASYDTLVDAVRALAPKDKRRLRAAISGMIGQKHLDPETARRMVEAREAKRRAKP